MKKFALISSVLNVFCSAADTDSRPVHKYAQSQHPGSGASFQNSLAALTLVAPLYHCLSCNESFNDRSGYNSHGCSHKSLVLACRMCGTHRSNLETFGNHLLSDHSTSN